MTNNFNSTTTQIIEESEFEGVEGGSQEILEPSEEQNIDPSSSRPIEDFPVGEFEKTSEDFPVEKFEKISENLPSQDSLPFRVDGTVRRFVKEQLNRNIDGDYITKDQKEDLEDTLGKPFITRQDPPQFVVNDKIKLLIQKNIGREIDSNFVNQEDKDKVENQLGIILPTRPNNSNVRTVFLAEGSRSIPSQESQKSKKKDFFGTQKLREGTQKLREILEVKKEKEKEKKRLKEIIKPLDQMPNNMEMLGETSMEPLPFGLTSKASVEAIENSLKIIFSRKFQEKTRKSFSNLNYKDVQLYAGRNKSTGNPTLILAIRNEVATPLSNSVITHVKNFPFMNVFCYATVIGLRSIGTTKMSNSIGTTKMSSGFSPVKTAVAVSRPLGSQQSIGLSQQYYERKQIFKKNIKQTKSYSSISSLGAGITNLVAPGLRKFKKYSKVYIQAYDRQANNIPAKIEEYILTSKFSINDQTLKKMRNQIILLDHTKKTQLFQDSAETFVLITQTEKDIILYDQVKDKALKDTAINHYKVNFLFATSDEIGLSNATSILNLLVKVHNMQKETACYYWPYGEGTNRIENKKRRETYENTPSSLESCIRISLPEGLPFIMMGFSNFMTFNNTRDVFKIKKDGKQKLKKDLKEAFGLFRKIASRSNTSNDSIEQIIFQVKQSIGRFEIIKTNNDHFFEEYWRGALSPTVTTRQRNADAIDCNAATIISARVNGIKSLKKNAFLPDQVKTKLDGIVTYSCKLYNYTIQSDLFRVAMQLDLQPYKYGGKKKSRNRINC